jgi:hypothetical protein
LFVEEHPGYRALHHKVGTGILAKVLNQDRTLTLCTVSHTESFQNSPKSFLAISYRALQQSEAHIQALAKKSSCSVASDVQTTQPPRPTKLLMHCPQVKQGRQVQAL